MPHILGKYEYIHTIQVQHNIHRYIYEHNVTHYILTNMYIEFTVHFIRIYSFKDILLVTLCILIRS